MTTQTKIPWEQIPPNVRSKLIWGIWFATWIGLLAGLLVNRVFYEYVVVFSALHAFVFWVLFGFSVKPFPMQLRVAYVAWVTAGTYVPALTFFLYITMIGLATNLFLGYCPMARILYLLPWNREQSFSWRLVKQVFSTPPVPGKFRLTP